MINCKRETRCPTGMLSRPSLQSGRGTGAAGSVYSEIAKPNRIRGFRGAVGFRV